MVSLNLISPYSLKNLNLDSTIDMIIFICHYYLILEIYLSDLYYILWETLILLVQKEMIDTIVELYKN